MHGRIERAPAKLNLVLRVGQRRPDGYHEVVSLMAQIDVVDTLIIAEAQRTSVTCPDIPGGDTLVTRALHDFKRATGHPGGFHVGIAKRIPIGAGLGGGSSDAAAALRGANALCDNALDPAELATLAAQIGSDVPFFLGPPVAIARGRGEDCTPAPPLPTCAFAVAYPGRALATRDVYDRYEPRGTLDRSLPPPTALTDLAAAIGNDLALVAESLEPACGALREALLERGALAASVSGSGSAVFGLFTRLEDAEQATLDLPGASWTQAATLVPS